MSTVLASGCFDPLHPGHVAFLQAARALGESLVVSVTTDPYVKQRRGSGHPFFPVAERYLMLQALHVVDKVILNDQPDAVESIRRIRPAIYATGADYGGDDREGERERERLAVEALGGRMEIIDAWPRYSSTTILRWRDWK